jgi:hypothetical protein
VPVFVSGDLVNASASWPALVGKLNSQVAVLPSVIEYPENFPASEFIINLGLASKELALEKEAGNYSLVNLNALPSSALPQPVNPYRIIVPIVAVAGIAVCFFMWNNWQTTKHDTVLLQNQLTSVQKQVTANAKTVATLTEQNRLLQTQIQPLVDAANVFHLKLTSITQARSVTNNDVHQIVALKPQTVDMLGMSYADSSKNINGTSATTADILKYAQALRDTGKYTMVVSSINYSPTITLTGTVIPVYNFSLLIK